MDKLKQRRKSILIFAVVGVWLFCIVTDNYESEKLVRDMAMMIIGAIIQKSKGGTDERKD